MSAAPSNTQGRAMQTVIELVDRQTLAKGEQPKIDIENVITAASFTWLDSAHPRIAVPGLPPKWTPPKTPARLHEDSGQYFRDQNAARFPEYPMMPAVQAIFEQSNNFETNDIDVFACGSTLGNLVRFARGAPKPFRFRVEMVGKTAFFVRQESSPTLLIEGVYGYGHTFPEAYTTWDKSVRGSESHQRIIRYSTGGKEMLVRFEADGYLPDKADKAPQLTQTSDASKPPSLDDDLAQLGVGIAPVQNNTLQTVPQGHIMQQKALFDLKTRSWKKIHIDVVGEELPRMWINQIPNFVLAFHRAGVFNDIRVLDVRDRVNTWQRTQQKDLQIYSALIDKICKAARQQPDSKLEVSYDVVRGLQLKTLPGKWAALPADLKSSWIGGVVENVPEVAPPA